MSPLQHVDVLYLYLAIPHQQLLVYRSHSPRDLELYLLFFEEDRPGLGEEYLFSPAF